MRRGGFPPPQMTKAANRDAFQRWCVGCTDKALETASASSLANSYGLDEQAVSVEIQRQILTRAASRRAAITREFGNGAAANRAGEPRSANPYRPSSELYDAWNAGWDEEEGPVFGVAS